MKDGGQAFPVAGTPGQPCEFRAGEWFVKPRDGYSGMTLRDYFASQALSGLCVVESWSDLQGHGALVASICYELADAMLAEREKEHNNA